MRIDFASLAFGYSVKSGGNTPNWAISLGQGKEYKINSSKGMDELIKGMVYSSVPLSKVATKIGKGGKTVYGNIADSPIIVASVFQKVYINDALINNGRFVVLITRDSSRSHEGRLRFKYGPSNSYVDDTSTCSNEMFWEKAKKQLGLAEEACFFVYDISVRNQDEMVLRTVIVNKHAHVEYSNAKELHISWDRFIEEDEKKWKSESDEMGAGNNNVSPQMDGEKERITPQWFEEKAVAFPNHDDYAKKLLDQFRLLFSPAKLKELSGVELLNSLFLGKNRTNLCYFMEFDNDCRNLFGSIKSGTSFKYGLFYSPKNASWVTGSSGKKLFLSEDEAIELGTQLRDYLVEGADIIENAVKGGDELDYQTLYLDLFKATEGHVNKVWFLKYYAMLYPQILPPIFSYFAQNYVLKKLGIEPGENPIRRMGQIRKYVDECHISNVVFNQIFWKYCVGDLEQNDDEENKKMNCLEVSRDPREKTIHPLNSIVYGAPGTGKTYSMVEYALSILDGISIIEFKENNPDRKTNVLRYKEYVKKGQIVFTTFHQSYGYEEFIQGLRPDIHSETMAFKPIDGVFKSIADHALTDKQNDYVIIIDEINRANISKVFGELITLIEVDKRWGEINETCVTLQSGDVFAVPNNLFIIGTMNSADKSISLIDAALRRRFEFIEQKPDEKLVPAGMLRKFFSELNANLVEQLDSTDLLIGHSYFMNKSEEQLPSILNGSIIPLLYEYFYDDRKKVATLLKTIIEKTGAKIELIDERVGRLKVKAKVD